MSTGKYYLCVTPFFPSPNNWRGSYVLDQVKAIKRNSDFEVFVFMEGGKNDADYVIDGIKVYRYTVKSLPSNILNGFFNDYNSRSFLKKVWSLGIDVEDIRVVHCHVSMRAACGLALKRLNPEIKVLLQHHDLDPFNLRSGVIGRYNRWNIRYRASKAIALYNQVDVHVCVSKACADSLKSFPNARPEECYDAYIRSLNLCKGLPSIQPKSVQILYNGVDCNLFHKREDALKCRKSPELFRIGAVANFNDLKGHLTLIKAFEELHKGHDNIVLSLLGTGETRRICEEYLRNHGLISYVEWPNEVTHNKLPEYFHTLDLFVLPSYFEGFGCVFTEAAACGIPFIGCVHQGYSEYITDKDKWLILPHDYKRLAELIESYMKSPVKQQYNHSFNIDDLVKDFLSELNY